ncbi:hypothetical protein ASD15_05340 [Massilia sp. Root351]|nr:hypothetical protein ASD15_05340 [Massilia sp. Root351]
MARIASADPGDVLNAKEKLDELVKTYIEEPSQLRNKIAHGQLVQALNSKNDDINAGLTADILSLDIVKLDRLRSGAQGLADMIEMIIESPEKNGMKHFAAVSRRIVEDLDRTQAFRIEDKIALIKAKYSRSPRAKGAVTNEVQNNQMAS